MGKVIEKARITNLFDPTKSVEIEAVIDTGATMLVLPRNIVDELGLKKIREVKVRYANNEAKLRSIYGVVTIEIKGCTGSFDVLAEAEGSQPLIGQVVLEILDLVVDPRTRTLMPNPASPEMPMVEILVAVVYKNGHKASPSGTKWQRVRRK
jgi:clan AA aspartic protease